MRTSPPGVLLAGLSLLTSVAQASVIYSHTFDGSNATALNGTLVDGGSATWTASGTAKADGTDSANSTAWLPYAFGSGVYTLTADIDVSALSSSSGGLAGITFTTKTGAFSSADFVSGPQAYATFGLRGTSNWDFWGGSGNSIPIDGGSATFPRVNTLKVVLDTTGTHWAVTASLLATGGVETFVDLNQSDSGSIAYTFATNPATFTGVGFSLRSSSAQIDSFTFSVASVPEPSAFALLLGAGTLAAVALTRHRRR